MDYVKAQRMRTNKIILIVFCVLMLGVCLIPRDKNTSTFKSDKEQCSTAYIMAKPLIAKQLDAPETAEFPFFTYHCERQDGNNYFIQGEVEFKNIYNVPFKKVYRAVVHFNGGEDADNKNWELVSFKFIV